MDETNLDCDTLVIGGGIAGLACAASAADRGGRVVLIEKTGDLGGNGRISNGYVWTCGSLRQLERVERPPTELGRLVVEGFPRAIAWLRERSLPLAAPGASFDGIGYPLDVQAFIRSCVSSIRSVQGHVVLDTAVERLTTSADGKVTGAVASHPDGAVTIRALNTVVATGGMQASAELLARIFGARASALGVRSRHANTGDGYRLATAVGAAAILDNKGFYGHLVASPSTLERHEDFVALTPYHSDRSILLAKSGKRICDESEGDNITAQALFASGSNDGLLVWDQKLEAQLEATNTVVQMSGKVELARRRGADAAVCESFDDVSATASRWGYDGSAVVASLREYNQSCVTAPEAMVPYRARNWIALDTAPFHLMRVRPAITFAFAGLRVDRSMRAVDASGRIIRGLLVAGVDVGDVWREGYAGGLSVALVTGLTAADTACGKILSEGNE